MCPAFRQSKVLAHGQEIKMPQGVSVVSTATESEGSLPALDKQHLSFTLLCRWGILCKTTAAFLTGSHRQGWRLTQWEQLRAACRFCNLLSPFWCGYTLFQRFVSFLQEPSFPLLEEGHCFLRLSAFDSFPFQGKLGVIIPYSIMQFHSKAAMALTPSKRNCFISTPKLTISSKTWEAEGQRVIPFPSTQVILGKSLTAAFVGDQSNLLSMHSGTLKAYRMSLNFHLSGKNKVAKL